MDEYTRLDAACDGDPLAQEELASLRAEVKNQIADRHRMQTELNELNQTLSETNDYLRNARKENAAMIEYLKSRRCVAHNRYGQRQRSTHWDNFQRLQKAARGEG